MPERITDDHLALFQDELLQWYRSNKREMPWRNSSDPYRIWLSEVMLQQTRVDQATPYYNEFIEAFPTLASLAEADQDEVLKLWEGLGYYSRARYLHQASKTVVREHNGRVPDDYDDFRALPGVGPYTAAAVLSIAYGMPHAVVDGNVKRVLARVFAIEGEIGRSKTKREIQELADELLPEAHPADFNQALMELGARICTPTSPDCGACPVANVCVAAQAGNPTDYPVKKKKKKVPHHDVVVGVLVNEKNELLIQKRPEDGMLGGLWEFPGGKKEAGETLTEACARELCEETGISVTATDPILTLKHAYSHFKITLHAFYCTWAGTAPTGQEGQTVKWVNFDRLDEYAFPRANRKLIEYLQKEDEQLSLFTASE